MPRTNTRDQTPLAFDTLELAKGPILKNHLNDDVQLCRHAHGDRNHSLASAGAREISLRDLTACLSVINNDAGRLTIWIPAVVLLTRFTVVADCLG